MKDEELQRIVDSNFGNINGYRALYNKGRDDRETEIAYLIRFFFEDWNKEKHKRLSYQAMGELIEFICQNDTEKSVERWKNDI